MGWWAGVGGGGGGGRGVDFCYLVLSCPLDQERVDSYKHSWLNDKAMLLLASILGTVLSTYLCVRFSNCTNNSTFSS